jgi:hypothetical protein
MVDYKVVIKRITSPDGKIIAEAKSIAIASGNNPTQNSQSISVNIYDGNSCSSRSTSS